jgi:hypothetical protein
MLYLIYHPVGGVCDIGKVFKKDFMQTRRIMSDTLYSKLSSNDLQKVEKEIAVKILSIFSSSTKKVSEFL